MTEIRGSRMDYLLVARFEFSSLETQVFYLEIVFYHTLFLLFEFWVLKYLFVVFLVLGIGIHGSEVV